jgi:hypothetical protein
MTVAIIRKLWSGGAVIELPKVQPHWFPNWHDAVDEAVRRRMEHVVLEPALFGEPVQVLARVPES